MEKNFKAIMTASLIVMLSACAAMNRGASDIRTIDHSVPHVSTVPAIKGETARLFVREKVLASDSAAPPPDQVAKKQLTAEEQMALYEQDLKENDWGHQPC